MQTYACFNMFLQKNRLVQVLMRGVQVFVRAILGKTRLVVDPATRCTALVVLSYMHRRVLANEEGQPRAQRASFAATPVHHRPHTARWLLGRRLYTPTPRGMARSATKMFRSDRPRGSSGC